MSSALMLCATSAVNHPRLDDPLEADHVVPLSLGAEHPGNLRPAHRSCNRRKGGAESAPGVRRVETIEGVSGTSLTGNREKSAPFLLLGQTTNQVPVICGWIKQWKL